MLAILFGDRYVVRRSRLVLAEPNEGELCVAKTPAWRRTNESLCRGPVTQPVAHTDSLVYVRVMNISVGDTPDERLSRFLNPLAKYLTPELAATGRELRDLAGAATGIVVSGDGVCITYLDMSTDEFGPDDVVVLRSR